MSTPTADKSAAALYERDFYAWCMNQAAALRGRHRPGENDELDYLNLAEEIESLARSDKRAIKSHLLILLVHLLKWRHQPELRGRGWRVTIRNAREAIDELLADSPSLTAFSRESIAGVYPKAVAKAAEETRLSELTFPAGCPFAEEQVFDSGFFPTDLDE
jgi:hypothetical protein